MLAVEKSHISGGACVVRRSDIRDEQSQTRRQNREKVRHKTGRQMSTGPFCVRQTYKHTRSRFNISEYTKLYISLSSRLSLSLCSCLNRWSWSVELQGVSRSSVL